jgi:methyltransferase
VIGPGGVAFVIAMVFGIMLAETRLSRRHERALRARGAIEPPGDVYPLMAVAYPAAFLLMGIEGFWRASGEGAGWDGGPSWFASGVLMFVAGKGLKYWAIRSLGALWSFRVLIVPGAPLVRTGPYAYVDHPNYIGIVGELAGTAMMVGALVLGPVMTVAFCAVLWARVRVETAALRRATEGRVSARP